MTATDPIAHLRSEVADACQVLGHNGHADYTHGHVAVRDPSGRGVWMKASRRGLDEVRAADVLLVGWDGDVLEGDGARHSEWPIHTELMLARPEVSVTVHSHPPHCIALGTSGRPLRPVSHAATAFVPPDVPRFDRTTDLIVDRANGRHLADAIGDRPAVLMVNHGIATVGASCEQAAMRAVLLEQACYHQLLAESMGGVARWSQDAEAIAKSRRVTSPAVHEAQFAYLLRRVQRG